MVIPRLTICTVKVTVVWGGTRLTPSLIPTTYLTYEPRSPKLYLCAPEASNPKPGIPMIRTSPQDGTLLRTIMHLYFNVLDSF